jgi:hypothetical protein
VDDELDLLPGEPDGAPPRRPVGLLVGALVVIALLAVGAVFWMVSEVSGPGGRVGAGGSPTAAATPTSAQPTSPEPTSAPPPTIPALPTATFSVPAVRSTVPAPTVAPPPKPVPKPTAPAPTPNPTLATPVGKLVTVPDVVGLRIPQAIVQIRAAGLKPQVLGGVLDVDRDQRRVIAQRPTAGSVLRAGATVILVSDGL